MLVELEELAANIDKDPGAVGCRAASLSKLAREAGDIETAAAAATLAARARRDLREIEAAEHAIDQAIALANSVGGDLLADAHMVAASIATHRRGSIAAAEHLDLAERHGSPQLVVKIRVQQAILAYRAGRLDEAAQFYEQAVPSLRVPGEEIMLARVLSNRGLVHTLRGDLDGAVSDFENARALFADAGQDVAVAFVLQNHGEAVARLGEVPAAVQLLDDAMSRLAEHGQPMYDAESSKAEAFVSAGLFTDAAELLSHAIDGLTADGDRAGAARAMLLRATALRLAGDPAAGNLAHRARREFSDLGLDASEAQAALEVVRSTIAAQGADSNALAEAEALAEFFSGNGHLCSTVEALSLATLLALTSDRPERAESLATRCDELAATAPFVEHRLAATHARAAVDVARGHAGRARRSIAAILDEFDRFRSTIGAPDGRRTSALHVAQLVELGSRLVAATGEARTALTWTERRRRSVDERGPRSSAGGTDVDTMISELRSVIDELRQVETGRAPSGRDGVALTERRILLERQITQRLLPTAAAADSDPTQPAADGGVADADASDETRRLLVADAFRAATGVSYDVIDDVLRAVVVRGGTIRLVTLGDARLVVRTAESARTLLSALAREASPGHRRDALGERLHLALVKLDHLAIAPLDLEGGTVVLSLPDDLHAAPWCALPALSDRSVTLASTLGRWARAQPPSGKGPDASLASVAAIAGPRLAHAGAEVEAVAACYDSSVVIMPEGSPPALVIDAFHRSAVVHIAAHARLRRDNPMWSTIELAETPLFAHRLLADADPPSIVVLAACESAVSTGLRGAPLSGFAAMLIDSGVDSVIASVGQLPDSMETVAVMTSLHRNIAANVAPSSALAKVRREFPDSVAARTLACWGRG